MSSSTIMLKPVKELLGMNFFIPDYQRGYRWKEQQALDLLEDIWTFHKQKSADSNAIYCIQPLVVQKKREITLEDVKQKATLEEVEALFKNEKWSVVDGQQRLTTIFLILSAIDKGTSPYSIEYETRLGSENYLKNIQTPNIDYTENIDYYHMHKVYQTVIHWLDKKDGSQKNDFKETLLKKVNFIWYQIPDGDCEAIAAFTRLNIGKIPLTDSELIKALFLNRNNLLPADKSLENKQKEIALEWDKIEYTLQNDEFWLFIHDPDYEKPTRIDFILDMVCKHDKLNLYESVKYKQDKKRTELEKKNKAVANFIGDDEHSTFRYFHYYFTHGSKDISNAWKIIADYYHVFNEWYRDYKMYHYIGYLMCLGKNQNRINELVEIWYSQSNYTNSKNNFINFLKKEIYKELKRIPGFVNLEEHKYVEEKDGKTVDKKGECVPILLLHNIETIIQQNDKLESYQKYNLPIFSKFPFHLYKRETWNVEHVRPNAGDDLSSEDKRKMYLCFAKKYLGNNPTLNQKISSYFDDDDTKPSFEEIQVLIEEQGEPLEDKDKNKIWNYVLLDESTNKEYGNLIFPVKRIFIANKENGKKIKYVIKDNALEEDPKGTKDEIAFVPPCTRNVFAKFYTDVPQTMIAWTKQDASEYLKDMKDKLTYYINLAKEEAK